MFAGSGALHLARPDLYDALIPRLLPAPGAVIAVTGIAELVCAVGLLGGRRWAGPASAVLLLVILPGNVNFAIETARDGSATSTLVALAWLRIPLQLPLIWAALQASPSDGGLTP